MHPRTPCPSQHEVQCKATIHAAAPTCASALPERVLMSKRKGFTKTTLEQNAGVHMSRPTHAAEYAAGGPRTNRSAGVGPVALKPVLAENFHGIKCGRAEFKECGHPCSMILGGVALVTLPWEMRRACSNNFPFRHPGPPRHPFSSRACSNILPCPQSL